MKQSANARANRTAVVVVICLGVGALHFVTGRQYRGPCRDFVNGYLIDILLPFALYFLLGQFKSERFRFRWPWKVAIVVGIGSAVELAQLAGIHVFGETFDPLDFFAYAAGALLGVAVDDLILSRWLGLWAARL